MRKMKIQFELFSWVIGLVFVIGTFCETVTSDSASTSASVQATFNSTSLPSFAPVLPPNPQDDKNDPEIAKRRTFVVNMMKHAWNGYVKCAWGKVVFRPIECAGDDGNRKIHQSYIWDAMPTLWIMGLRDEFSRAQEWIEQKVNTSFEDSFQIDSPNVAFNTFPGAMLSCYSLTGDTFFRESAIKYAQLYMSVNRDLNEKYVASWKNAQLELPYLTHLTGNQSFQEYLGFLQDIMDTVPEYRKPYDYIFSTNGDYLLLEAKQYIQTGLKNRTKIDQFYRLLEDMKKKEYLNRTQSGLWYFGSKLCASCGDANSPDKAKRYFPAGLCNIGAALSFAAELIPKVQYNVTSWRKLGVDKLKNIITQWEMAKNITDTCYWGLKYASDYMIPLVEESEETGFELYTNSTSIVDSIIKADFVREPEKHVPRFDLGSYQVVESYFTLWRKTGEGRYRDYAWEMAIKINQHARVPNGYNNGPVSSIGVNDQLDRDLQFPEFFTTLSYLYLTFTPDSYLPLDKWLLNSAGHPLPICGSGNRAYPKVKCF